METKKTLRNNKIFVNNYQKVVLNVIYTNGVLMGRNKRMLEPYDVSPQQYYVLRVLGNMHPVSATVKSLTDKMIDKMSNTSRLVEKLKQKGLVERDPSTADRRRVEVKLTEKGMNLIETTVPMIDEQVDLMAQCISPKEVQTLNSLLDKLRKWDKMDKDEREEK